jgi:hypothetical protein
METPASAATSFMVIEPRGFGDLMHARDFMVAHDCKRFHQSRQELFHEKCSSLATNTLCRKNDYQSARFKRFCEWPLISSGLEERHLWS